MQHVPYDSRNREVVYILEPPKRKSNGFGVTGFVLSILGFFTCFTLSPLALLFSLLGMFKAPRGLATAGTLLSLIGTGTIAGVVLLSAREDHMQHHRMQTSFARNVTEKSMRQAKHTIESWRVDHDHALPEGVTGNKMVLNIEDGWRTSLGYEPDENGYTLRSAGPDRDFNTDDDITSRVALTAAERLSLEMNRSHDGNGIIPWASDSGGTSPVGHTGGSSNSPE